MEILSLGKIRRAHLVPQNMAIIVLKSVQNNGKQDGFMPQTVTLTIFDFDVAKFKCSVYNVDIRAFLLSPYKCLFSALSLKKQKIVLFDTAL